MSLSSRKLGGGKNMENDGDGRVRRVRILMTEEQGILVLKKEEGRD